jgi:hypothetical protein
MTITVIVRMEVMNLVLLLVRTQSVNSIVSIKVFFQNKFQLHVSMINYVVRGFVCHKIEFLNFTGIKFNNINWYKIP